MANYCGISNTGQALQHFWYYNIYIPNMYVLRQRLSSVKWPPYLNHSLNWCTTIFTWIQWFHTYWPKPKIFYSYVVVFFWMRETLPNFSSIYLLHNSYWIRHWNTPHPRTWQHLATFFACLFWFSLTFSVVSLSVIWLGAYGGRLVPLLGR